MDNLVTYIESLVFASDTPITREEIRYALENCFDTALSPEAIDEGVNSLKEKFADEKFAIEVNEIAGGLQFLTKPAYHHVIGSHLKQITKKRLSRVALETLAIIAYKQPVTKTELERIRGVNCDYAIQKLLDKELIEIDGRSDGPGRPLLYSTSEKFMDYLGLKDLTDLPKLKDFQQVDNSIGEPAPVEEDVNEDSSVDETEKDHGEAGSDTQPVKPVSVSDDETKTRYTDDSEE